MADITLHYLRCIQDPAHQALKLLMIYLTLVLENLLRKPQSIPRLGTLGTPFLLTLYRPKYFFLSFLMVAKILRKPEDPLLLYKLILCHISAALGNKGYLSSRKKNTSSITVTAVLLR